ncbi:MAG: glycosyltransferase family 4 protein [Candidatus Edwardsbacteria bacterium]|nr:glycosyltransferase family 4 protein [Candidatus Edwardsbacteria bacterium]
MKILAIQNFMRQRDTGGAELLCHDLFTGLARLGHRVDVVTAGPEKYDDGYHVEPVMASNPRVEQRRQMRTPLAKLRWLQVARRNYRVVQHAVRTRRPDVVYLHNLEWTTLSPLTATLDSSVPAVTHCHNHYYGEYWQNDRHAPSLVQRLSRTGPALEQARLIAVSRAVARPLAEHGFPPDRLQVVYNGLPDEILGGDVPAQRQRKLLFVGAVSRHKGTHVALEALALLRDRGLVIPLEIIGTGHSAQYQGQLIAFIRREKLGNQVTYAGALLRRDVWARMRAVEIVVVPSLCAEAFGLAAAEAMACGAIPVVSDRGALPEVMADHGIVAEPTAQGFADAIRRAIGLTQQEKLERRKKAQDHVRRNFRLTDTVAKVESILRAS